MLSESLLIKSYRGQPVPRPPIWLMRQAGRYLPEYLAVRAKYSINEVINNPDLAFEVTMQPIRRFGFDASIVFADLLTPLQGLGFKFDFLESIGPKLEAPIKDVRDLERLTTFIPEEAVAGTLDAIKLLSAELQKTSTPLIGFAGAPFTVSSYLIEGKSNPKLNLTKKFFFENPEAWAKLQEHLVVALTDYLLAQVQAGCQALQIFDSWLGGMSLRQYQIFVKPYLEKLITNLKAKTDCPIVFFGTGLYHLSSELKNLNVECQGVDWRQSLTVATQALGGKFCLQGNLDPLMLFADWQQIEIEVDQILREAEGLSGFVFNLGHGILPQTPIANVEKLVEKLKNYGSR